MINLSAIGAFYVKMTLAFFVIDELINKASAVAFNGAVNKTFFNQLCHQSVCGALAYFIFVHSGYYFFNCEGFFTV